MELHDRAVGEVRNWLNGPDQMETPLNLEGAITGKSDGDL